MRHPLRKPPARKAVRPSLERLEDRMVLSPTLLDPNLEVRTVAAGLPNPTTMAFLRTDTANDFLVLEKNTGVVQRVIGNVKRPVLDLGVNNFSERGLLGIALHPNFHDADPATPQYVYLYWTESSTGFDTNVPSATTLLGNRVDRFAWNGSALEYDQTITRIRAIQQDAGQPERGNHDGGVIRFGPDGKLYVIVGDVGRRGFMQNVLTGFGPGGQDDEFGGPEPGPAHLTGVILRLNDDGTTPEDNPFFQLGADIGAIAPEVGAALQKVYGYGVRNSFGMAFDPVSGQLWTVENGDDSYSEINLVGPGFNGGWVQVMGPLSRVADFKLIETGQAGFPNFAGLQQIRFPPSLLPDTPDEALSRMFLPDGAVYTDPQFSWRFETAPTGVGFLSGSALGEQYAGDLFTGFAVPILLGGPIMRFDLSADRQSLVFSDPRLADLVADNVNKHEATESESLIFGVGFGVVTDILTGPNGSLFVVSASDGAVYEVRARTVPRPEGETTFFAILTGSQEPVPAGGTGSTASAVARFTLNADQTRLSYEVLVFNLDLNGQQTPATTQDNVTGLHLHRAPAGVNGPIVFGIISPDHDLDPSSPIVSAPTNRVGGTVTGDWDFNEGNPNTPADPADPSGGSATLTTELDDLFAENLYLNIHTTRFPGGEIRGQIRLFGSPNRA